MYGREDIRREITDVDFVDFGRKKEEAGYRIEVFKICKGYTRINPNNLFYFDSNRNSTRSHSLKLVKLRCGTLVNTFFRVITRWHLLDQGSVDATSVNARRLEKFKDIRMDFFMD